MPVVGDHVLVLIHVDPDGTNRWRPGVVTAVHSSTEINAVVTLDGWTDSRTPPFKDDPRREGFHLWMTNITEGTGLRSWRVPID